MPPRSDNEESPTVNAELILFRLKRIDEAIDRMERRVDSSFSLVNERIERQQEKLDGINAKIAMWSGGIAVVLWFLKSAIQSITLR